MDAKRQRLDDSLARPAPSSFAPSPTFTGRRPGFFFSRGPGGAVGYWPDARQQAAAGLMPPPPPRPPAAPAPAPDGAALLAAAEAAVDPAALAELDGRAVRRLVLALERRARDNLEARLAHAAQPQRFLDSEVDLHEEVLKLSRLSAQHELYPALLDSGALPTLLQLLLHENADVAAAVAGVLRDLCEPDDEEEAEAGEGAAAAASAAGWRALCAALCAPASLDALLAGLSRFDEAEVEQAGAAAALLGALDGCCDAGPAACDPMAAHRPLLAALLARACRGPARGGGGGGARADAARAAAAADVRAAAAELLCCLAGRGPGPAAALCALGGVEAMLVALAPFRKRAAPAAPAPASAAAAPAADADAEAGQNLCTSLCGLLTHAPLLAVPELLRCEGVQLCLLLARARGPLRPGALRVLDHALSPPGHPGPARALVDAGGLGAVFAAFGGRSAAAAAARRGADAAAEEGDRAASLVASLLAHCPWGGDGRRARVVAKFAEGGFEKADRAAQLWAHLTDRARQAEADLVRADPGADGDDVAAARLDAGAGLLPKVAATVAALLGCGHPPLARRAAAALALAGATRGQCAAALDAAAGEADETAEAAEARAAARAARAAAAAGGGGGAGAGAQAQAEAAAAAAAEAAEDAARGHPDAMADAWRGEAARLRALAGALRGDVEAGGGPGEEGGDGDDGGGAGAGGGADGGGGQPAGAEAGGVEGNA